MVFQTVIGGYRSLELVSWANGTPAQIAAMLDAHYEGRINLANYWSVGDTRTVGLDAIEANDCTDAMAIQTAQLVLMNAGGKTLVNPINGRNTCAFVVGFKNSLSAAGKFANGQTIFYSNSDVRQFLNNQIYLSLPSDIQRIFKSFVNVTHEGDGNYTQTEDLFALPASVEVFGSGTYTYDQEGSRFTYYNTNANRIKTQGGTAADYWLRTCEAYFRTAFASSSGTLNYSGATQTTLKGISPFGVI